MKIYKTAANRLRVSLTKEEWITIGKQKGWTKSAQTNQTKEIEKQVDFVVRVDQDVVNEFGKVFYDKEFELGLSMNKEESRFVYDLLYNKAQSQEGIIELDLLAVASWSDQTYVPYQETEVGMNDSGWNPESISIISGVLKYVDKITQKTVEIKLSDRFIKNTESTLSDYLNKLLNEIDFGTEKDEHEFF